MKIFAYCLREFDEKAFFDQICKDYNAEYAYTTEYPNPDNIELARGYDAISVTPCDLGIDMLDRFYQVGIRYIATRVCIVLYNLKHRLDLSLMVFYVLFFL